MRKITFAPKITALLKNKSNTVSCTISSLKASFIILLLVLITSGSVWGQCGPFQVFESIGTGALPTQGGTWTVNSITYNNAAGNPRSGAYCFGFNAVADNIRTPLIVAPGIFSFWYSRNATATGTPSFIVETSPDNTTWTTRATITTFTTTMVQYSIDLGALSLTNIYVRIRDARASGTVLRFVDDISWTSTTASDNNILIQGTTCSVSIADGATYYVYDKGGVNDTYNNSMTTAPLVITPSSAGSFVSINFTSLYTENVDYLKLYNGNTVATTALHTGTGFSGTTTPGSFTSTHTSGALTIDFTSDSSIAYTGFVGTITCPPPCSGTPAPGNTLALPTGVASGGTTVLSLQNTISGSGVSYQWQSSSNNSTFTNISGATSATYTTAAITTSTYYRCQVTCSASGLIGTATSQLVQVITTTTLVPTSSTSPNSVACGTNTLIYDQGGVNADYTTNSATGYTILNNSGTGIITLNGTYNLENTFDKLWIYNGNAGSTGTLLAGPYTGTGTIPTFTSTAGQTISVQITTDGSTNFGTTSGGIALQANYSGACGVITSSVSSLTAFSSCSGAASANQSFTVSGTDMVGGITVTAPTGYEVCATAGGTYTSSIVIGATGTIATTSVYVRLTSGATGTPAGNISLTNSNAATKNVAVTGTVLAISAAPVVTSPIYTNATSVSGTSSEANTTTITVYSGATNLGTTTVTSGVWTKSGLSALALAASITATATAPSKCVSAASAAVVVISNGITSATSGLWSSGATWVGGTAPASGANATILSGHTVTMDGSSGALATRNSGTTTTVDAGGILATGMTYTNNGTTTINGTFQLNSGGWATGTDLVYHATTGILAFESTTNYGVGNDKFWSTTTGPQTIYVNHSSGITMNVARTVGTLFQSAGSVVNPGNLTLNGILKLNNNYNWSGSGNPTYGASSLLWYNSGGSPGRGAEWTAASGTIGTTAGYPNNVQISNTTTLNFANGSSSTFKADKAVTIDFNSSLYQNYGGGNAALVVGTDIIINGNLTLGTSSGDLTVGGNMTRGASGAFAPNGRAVFFNGSGTQTVTVTGGGTETFNYLLVQGSGTLKLATGTNVTVNYSNGLSLSSSNATSTIDLNGQTFEVSGGGNLSLNTGTRLITNSSGTAATFKVSNATTITSGGTLSFPTNATVLLTNSLNFGSGLTTVNGTLQINSGGSVNTNPPKYGASSLLYYFPGATFNRGAEWNQASGTIGTTAGYPNNVQIGNATTLNFNNGSAGPFKADKNLTIDLNSALYQNYGGGSAGLEVGGNLVLNGTLGLGSAALGDFTIGGNWTNSGSFSPNGRAVTFNGTGAQTLTGATTFDYLTMNNSSTGLTLNNSIIVNNDLTLTSGKITLGANNLTTAQGITSSATNYIVENGSGYLKRLAVGNVATLFPVGLNITDYTPITLTVESGTSDLSVLVSTPITNAVADATKVVTLQWGVTSSAATTVTVTPTWKAGNQGASFNIAATTGELGNYIPSAYTIYPTTASTTTSTATGVSLQNGSNLIVVGNTNEVVCKIPTNIVTAVASNLASSSAITWTAPLGCKDEIMIVARLGSANDGTPAGDGTAYTASLTYASGTALGNGYVVYKGSTSPQTVTGLTNGTTYYFKLFTRKGTVWSSGIEITATPVVSYCTPTEVLGSASYYLNSITTIGGITNLSYSASSYAAYVNNSATTFSQIAGNSVSVTLGATSTNGYWYAWVDWNNNGVFTDLGEDPIKIESYTNSPYTGSITVPPGQVLGNYRVRFSMDYIYTSTSCVGGTYGNYVDLTFSVVTPPVPTITSLGSSPGCVGSSITINGTGLSGAIAADVKIGGTAVTSITSNSGTVLIAVIGAGTTGTVAVTTAGGTATSVATFTVNTTPTANAGVDISLCTSTSSMTIGGSPAASGSTSPYTYSWSPATELSAANVANPICSATATRTYTLTVTAANGCSATDDVVVGYFQNNTFIGTITSGGDTSLNTPANWSLGHQPTRCENAIITLVGAGIPANTYYLGLQTADFECNDLTITWTGNGNASNVRNLFIYSDSYNYTIYGNLSLSNALTTGAGGHTLYFTNGNGNVTIYGTTTVGQPSQTYQSTIAGQNASGTGVWTFYGDVTYGPRGAHNDTRPFVFDKNGSQTLTNNTGYVASATDMGSITVGSSNNTTLTFAGTAALITRIDSAILNGTGGGNLTVNSGSTLILPSGFTLNQVTTSTGALIVNGSLKLGGITGGQGASNFPSGFLTNTLATTSTVEYYGGTQTIFATPTYGNLTLSTSGLKTAGAALTVKGNVLINSPSTFASSTFLHGVEGNWTNNGTFSFISTGSTAKVTFTGTSTATISGASATDFYKLAVNKGSDITSILDITGAVSVNSGGALTLPNGLLRVSSGATFTNSSTTNTTIASTSGILVNGGTTTSTASYANNGLYRVVAGTATIGAGTGNSITNATGSTLDVQGGTLAVSGRLVNTAGTYLQSGGTVTLCTVGNTSTSFASFDMSLTTNLNISGGTVVFQNPNTASPTLFNDINILNSTGTKTIIGGTFQMGNTSTAASQTFIVGSAIPFNNFTVNATNAPIVKLVTNNLTIDGTLTLNGGNIDGATNSKDVVVTNSATSAIVRTAGYINGNLTRALATTGVAYDYPVGLSATADYLPAALTFTNLTNGNLTVKATTDDTTDLSSSSIDATKSVNAFWALSGTAASTNYAGTLTYPSGLIDGAATASGFKVGAFNTTWSYPTVTAASTTSLSFTAASVLGNLAVGNCKTPTAVVTSSQTICQGTVVNVTTATATNGAILWTHDGAGSLTDATTPTPTYTPAAGDIGNTVTLTMTVTGLCEVKTATYIITVNAIPTAAAGGTQTICQTGTATVSGASSSNGTILWTSSGAGSLSGESTLTPIYTPALADAVTTVTLTMTVSNSPCTAAVATYSVMVDATSSAGTPTADETICSGKAAIVSVTGATGSIQWQQSANGSSGWANVVGASGTTATYTTPVLTSTTYYQAVATNGVCGAATTAPITITIKSTTWTGSGWSNGNPDATTGIIFDGAYTSSANIAACSCTLTSNAVVTIAAGNTLSLLDAIDASSGAITFEDTSSLLQSNNVTNTGAITYKRKTSALNNNYDFVYWGSPVAAQPLARMWMSVTSNDTFYKYNGGVNWTAVNANSLMTPGLGYIARARNNGVGTDWTLDSNNNQTFTLTNTWEARFHGVPNNGDIPVDIKKVGASFDNLIANPYPSAIDLELFNADTENAGKLTGNILFWTHSTVIAGNAYTGADYATYNISTSSGTASNGGTGNNAPDKYVDSGQGFFVEYASGSDIGTQTNTIKFKNSHRVAGSNNGFYRTALPNAQVVVPTIENHNVWLNLTNSIGGFKQLIVQYAQGATYGYDLYLDAISSQGNSYIDFYSIIPNRKFTINSRVLPFQNIDTIDFGYHVGTAGTFQIAIDHVNGFFLTSENIYLEDKLLNTTVDLRLAPYSFTTAIGTFNTRFVLHYLPTSTLGTGSLNVENSVQVITNEKATVYSSNQSIKNIVVFDLLGRKIDSYKNVGLKQFTMNNLNKTMSGLFVKITLENDVVVTKKIVF